MNFMMNEMPLEIFFTDALFIEFSFHKLFCISYSNALQQQLSASAFTGSLQVTGRGDRCLATLFQWTFSGDKYLERGIFNPSCSINYHKDLSIQAAPALHCSSLPEWSLFKVKNGKFEVTKNLFSYETVAVKAIGRIVNRLGLKKKLKKNIKFFLNKK